jgi:hypothetical protein
MSTTWTLTAGEIIKGALETCQAIGIGEPVSAEDSEVCMRALNGLIKELPIHGIGWFKVTSTDAAITWSIGTPSVVSAPSDYFGVPVLKFTDANGVLIELLQAAKAEWELLDKTKTAQYPLRFYMAPDATINLWPAPTQDPVLKLSYQAVADDASLTVTPDIQQAFLSSFQDWLADKIALKFAPPELRQEITQRATLARALIMQWSTETAPISFQVLNQ